MLLAGVAFALASAVVFLLADSVPMLLVGRVLSGLSAGVFTGTATAAVIEAAPPAWRDRAAAVATVANIGGLGAGPLLAGLLVQYAPRPLQLSFVVHIVLAAAGRRRGADRAGNLAAHRHASACSGCRCRPRCARCSSSPRLAAFAGFAVTGLFTAVAPSFVADVIGIDNHARRRADRLLDLRRVGGRAGARAAVPDPQRAVAVGCAILVVGMVILAVGAALLVAAGLIAAAVVAGVGQGISFSRGLAAVAERTPADRRAEVSSTYFVVAYVAISLPVVGEGLAARAWGLRTAGVSFAVAVAILAAVCLVAILVQEARESPPARHRRTSETVR